MPRILVASFFRLRGTLILCLR